MAGYSEDVSVNLNVVTGTMSGMTAIASGMSALTSSFGAMGTAAANSFGTLDGLLVSATALISTFAAKSAEAFGQYEQGMKIVQTVSGQASYAMNELSNKANEMSIAYRTSIGDITDGLQTLGRAGLNSVNEQLEVLESGLQTAKLEGRSLNGVLEEIIQNTAMLGGDLKSINFGEQAEYLNSLMVGTSMTAPITSHDISQTLQYAGGTAAAAGANLDVEGGEERIEDLMGTIAAFAQKGVKGSMAGTALRAFFTKPASQDDSVVNALASIGLKPEDLWENGGESMKKVSDQVGLIQNRMESLNMSTMDQVELWGKMVGPKMGQQMMKLDASSIKEITRDIQDANSAEELAQQTLYTYTQQLSEMQQQGELAFREFGAKVATFLKPAVWIITQILGLLSNPAVNFGAFALIGALLSHGIQKAWAMAKAFFSEIHSLLSQTVSAIQNINGLASGGASGFSQTSSQVDFLNKKLHETDATLQAIQAKALGIKPGYIMPGMHGFEKVPAGTLKAYEENVVIDKEGVMNGTRGQIYSGDKADTYKKNLKDREVAIEQELKQIKEKNENEIAALERENAEILRKREEEFTVRQKEELSRLTIQIDEAAAAMKKLGVGPTAYNQLNKAGYFNLDPDDPRSQFMLMQAQEDSLTRNESVSKWVKQEKAKARTEVGTRLKNELKGQGSETLRANEMRIVDLKNRTAGSEEYAKRQTQLLKKMEKQGVSKILTRTDMLTTKQYESWINGIDESSTEVEKYSKARTLEMMKKNPEIYEKYAKQGYVPVFRSSMPDEPHINTTQLGQLENMGTLQKYVDADQQRLAQQKALWNGETAYTKRMQNLATQRMDAWKNAMNKGINAMTGIPNRIKNIPGQLAQKTRDPSQYIKSNLYDIKFKTAALNLDKLSMSGMKTVEAMDLVARELGLTRTEFSMIMTDLGELGEVSNLSSAEIKQLTSAQELLKQKIIEITAAEGMDAEALEQHAVKVGADTMEIAKSTMSKAADTATNNTTGIMSKLGSMLSPAGGALKSIIGMMGGPLMAGMMGFMLGMQAIQKWQQEWQEKMQEATNNLSEAVDKMSESTDKIKELYSSENENMTEADLDKAVDAQYASVYDSFYNGVSDRSSLGNTEFESDVDIKGLSEEEIAARNEEIDTITLTKNENVAALKENTMQLVAATAAYNQAQNRQVKQYNDAAWGADGTMSDITDQLGEWQEEIWNTGSFLWRVDRRAGFLDGHSPVLTGSQADSNYGGSTDLAGIFAADINRFDDESRDENDPDRYTKSLQQFFGKDFDRIISLMSSMDGKMSNIYGQNLSGTNALYTHAANMANMDASEFGMAQMSLKNNPETYQRLGKQMFRYEQSTGFKRTAYDDYGDISKASKAQASGDSKEFSKAMKNLGGKSKLSVQDRNLDTTIKKLMTLTDNKLSYQNILALGQLQQLQDMYTVANETVAPGIMQTVQGVFDNVSQTNLAATKAGGAESGAVSAANNAAAIAAFLGAEAQSNAEKAAYQKYNRAGGTKNFEEFVGAVGRGKLPQYERTILKTLEGTSWSLMNGDADPKHVNDNANRLYDNLDKSNKSYQAKLDTATWGILNFAQKAVMAAYDESTLGEYGGGQRSTGSGDSKGEGDGGSGSDKGTGTKKERVDLVLCNKKEIPKLNVNLFKKPPSFTVLNKNFKLRDIKINSQDKPKAIMNAIKNGIIETQKRMDPKIIQDDVAEFDPVEATEGNSVPRGNTKVTS